MGGGSGHPRRASVARAQLRAISAVGLALLLAGCGASNAAQVPQRRPSMPRYEHILVIVDENKGFHQLMDNPEWAPTIHQLADEYGTATQFYAEVHSSEGNYIAMLGGDTFGIHDDDPFYCRPGTQCRRMQELRRARICQSRPRRSKSHGSAVFEGAVLESLSGEYSDRRFTGSALAEPRSSIIGRAERAVRRKTQCVCKLPERQSSAPGGACRAPSWFRSTQT